MGLSKIRDIYWKLSAKEQIKKSKEELNLSHSFHFVFKQSAILFL